MIERFAEGALTIEAVAVELSMHRTALYRIPIPLSMLRGSRLLSDYRHH